MSVAGAWESQLGPRPRSAGLVRDSEDVHCLKNPTLFIFAENDAVIPLEQVRGIFLFTFQLDNTI